MSVPRPAILVATVTALTVPALAIIAASRSCCLAFNTSWAIPRRFRIADSSSDFSTLTVPTNTGWPFLCRAAISSATAVNLPTSDL